MAYVPPTKKTFSYGAIAKWGERLSVEPNSEWEKFLIEEKDGLFKGQLIYRETDHPVEVSVEDDTAFVSIRSEDQVDIYVFFHLDETGKINWRSSLSDRSEAAPYAAASMYFLEEFVAEEFERIPMSVLSPPTTSPHVNVAKEKSPLETPANNTPEENTLPTRLLELSFTTGATSLVCKATWFNEKDSQHTPTFGEGAVPASSLSKVERVQLLRLAAFARDALFFYDPIRSRYTLFGALRISDFVNRYLDKWKKRFRISNPEVLEDFRRSPRELDAEAILRAGSRETFSLKWGFFLGGKALSQEEREIALKHASEAFFLPGRGVVKLRSVAQGFVSDWPDPEMHGLPIYTVLSLFRNEKVVKISLDRKLAAWRRKFLAEPKIPANLPEFLRPYQVRGAAWVKQMLERGAHPLMADEMGLGKTVQVLTVLSLGVCGKAPALVVCPASVVPVWRNEIQKFFPGSEVCAFSPKKKTWVRLPLPAEIAADKNPSPLPRICIVSYGNLRRNTGRILRRKFGCAILDEAQFIKNPKTKVAQACLKIRAKHRLALTGTPIENRHLDLWTLFRFLMPGLLGRRLDLESALAEATDQTEILERLRTQISPFILRRTKSEVAKDLPDKTQNVLFCPMSGVQRDLYSKITTIGLEIFGGEKVSAKAALRHDAVNLLAILMRLRQAACDPTLLPGVAETPFKDSGKISVLLERAQEIIDNGGKIVIFSQFVRFLDRVSAALKEYFPEVPQFVLTGKTLDRAAPVRDFQTAEGSAFFLASLRAGGTGLTLSSAEYVFLLDPWWNPAVEEQAIDRVHRIGQMRRVFVYRMIAAGTIEERVEKLKQSKRELFGTLIGGIPDMSDWAQHYPSLESLIALSE